MRSKSRNAEGEKKENKDKIILGKRFEPSNYYDLGGGFGPEEDDSFFVRLKAQGMKLIQQYYYEKYQTVIQLADDEKSLSEIIKEDKDIQLAKKRKEEFRKVFIIEGHGHSSLFAYIKNNEGKEAILCANSLGYRVEDAEKLSKELDIFVYISHIALQKDQFSCHTDALVRGRIITARNPKGEYFRSPQLLLKLEERAEEVKPKIVSKEMSSLDPEEKNQVMSKIFLAKLPSELLITHQRLAFFEFNKEKNE